MDVTLTRTTYLSIAADHIPPFMEIVFPDGCGLFQQDNMLCHKANMVQKWFEEHNEFDKVLNWPPYSPDLNPIEHLCYVLDKQVRGPTLPLTGLEGSADNILVPDTAAHIQGSGRVHTSMGQGCFGSKRVTNTILGRWSK